MAEPNAAVTALGDATKPQMRKAAKAIDTMEPQILEVLVELEDVLGRDFASYAPPLTDTGKSAENIAAMEEMLDEVRRLINAGLLDVGAPGIQLMDKWNKHMVGLGIERLQVELDAAVELKLLNAEKFKAVFENFGTAESGSIAFGRKHWLRSYEYHGDNIVDFFVRTTEQSMIDAIPTVGRGDTLASRLFKSKKTKLVDGRRVPEFRLNDLTVTDRNGVQRIVTAENRARMMARTEIARIESQAFHSKAAEVGLDDVMTLNPSPVAPQCIQAVQMGVVTRAELEEAVGLSPRHPNCESREIVVGPGWNF